MLCAELSARLLSWGVYVHVISCANAEWNERMTQYLSYFVMVTIRLIPELSQGDQDIENQLPFNHVHGEGPRDEEEEELSHFGYCRMVTKMTKSLIAGHMQLLYVTIANYRFLVDGCPMFSTMLKYWHKTNQKHIYTKWLFEETGGRGWAC